VLVLRTVEAGRRVEPPADAGLHVLNVLPREA
jgi:hypothetical protein